MDNLETPYDEDDGFIECTICEKSLRGNTLYKIHLTTPGHLKKEDALVAEGKAVREHIMPKFKDILHYLEYLNLDEPIIGLNFLEEVANFEPQLGARYTCKLCSQTSNLAEMVCHVIGRKHRQKYVEIKRPDLVTWDSQTINTQGGKIMRAKAEIVERQNGRGVPEPLLRKGVEGRLNITRVPKQRQRFVPDVPPLLPELREYRPKKDFSGIYPDHLSRGRFEEGRRGADYMEGPSYREDRMNLDCYTRPLPEYADDPLRSTVLDPRDVSRYDHRPTAPQSQDYLPEASAHKRPYAERDPLEEFYSEEIRRGQVRSQGYQPSPKMMYTEDEKLRRSLEREPGRFDNMRRHGSSEPEAKRRNLSAPFEGDRSRESSFDILKDYHHERKDSYQEEAFKRGRLTSAQTHGEGPSAMSNIPEPFRRFLKGNGAEEGMSRRKSRFSDATPDEVKMAKEMYRDDYGLPYTQTGADVRPVDAPMRPDIHYREPLPSHHGAGEVYSRGGFDTTSIFDLLKTVEIDNAEEANFLKSKISKLLEEFKSKKMEKAGQYDHGRAKVSKNYSDLNPNPQLPQVYQYDRPAREESDLRRSEELGCNNGNRLGWEQRDQTPAQRFHEYNHGEPRHSSRSRFEDNQPQYPESMHPHDYKAPSENYFDPHSSVPSLQMEQDGRMHREPRYSSNMDKITCALMDLVARK
ncbi:uncharacterized protein LOC103135075 isoform X1 [Poecilia formosa]|uniref:uncharacterized protein LOC103135075 isoform X1 n=2 Tax=Poecilia formosa TaxID=48698 RepID=UPI000443D593|nr:PREDICTED: uncharacterized protein LOC103135075 isoform X1 [Poecilia formosa]